MFKKIKNLKNLNLVKIFRLENVGKKLLIVMVLVIFFILNYLISFISLRVDLSKGRAYTLSKSSKKILHDLTKNININFFVSTNLPSKLLPLKNDINDLLIEYKKAGGSKIVVKIIDPKKDENAQKSVNDFGIPELQFSQLEKDKYAVTTAYFGIGLSYYDKKEAIPQVTDIENLEYNLTSSIYKMAKKELPKVGVVGESPASDLSSLKTVLNQQFEINTITFDEANKTIDQSYKTILVFGNVPISDEEIKEIKNYLDKGGRAVFLTDGVTIGEDLTVAQAVNDFAPIFSDYGLKINKNLVLSTSAELVNFGNNLVSFFSPYAFWIKTNIFNSNTSYFSNVGQLTFPWVSSIETIKKNNVSSTELVLTNERSWQQKESTTEAGFFLDPQQIPQPNSEDLKQYVLVAELKKGKSQIIVIPSSRFVSDNFLSRTSNNLDFILNLLNETASEGALSGIRQRVVSFYPLPDFSDGQKDIFKYINILLLPAAFVGLGLYKLLKKDRFQ